MRIPLIIHLYGGSKAGAMGGIQLRASGGLALTGVGGIALLGNLLDRHKTARLRSTSHISFQ